MGIKINLKKLLGLLQTIVTVLEIILRKNG
jgi:hypothetical protein